MRDEESQLSATHRTGTALRRTAIQALPTMLGIIVLCLLLLRLVPGDAADVLAAENGSATAETMQALRMRFGLDQPVLAQLASYLVHSPISTSAIPPGSGCRYRNSSWSGCLTPCC
jgi:hypothetical protein